MKRVTDRYLAAVITGGMWRVCQASGKTHLAISLAITAAQAGRRVYYGTLAATDRVA